MNNSRMALGSLPVLLTVGLSFVSCVSPQVREGSMTRISGARVDRLNFDAGISREQYVLIGSISGEGTIERRNMGKQPKERSLLGWLVPDSYQVLEYDHTLGVWTDEARIDTDAMSDNKMAPSEIALMGTMETIAARIALHNALASMPEADAVLAPRYEFTYTTDDHVLGKDRLVSRSIVGVKARMTGKAVRLKTEEELYRTYKEYPGLLGPEGPRGRDTAFAFGSGD